MTACSDAIQKYSPARTHRLVSAQIWVPGLKACVVNADLELMLVVWAHLVFHLIQLIIGVGKVRAQLFVKLLKMLAHPYLRVVAL